MNKDPIPRPIPTKDLAQHLWSLDLSRQPHLDPLSLAPATPTSRPPLPNAMGLLNLAFNHRLVLSHLPALLRNTPRLLHLVITGTPASRGHLLLLAPPPTVGKSASVNAAWTNSGSTPVSANPTPAARVRNPRAAALVLAPSAWCINYRFITQQEDRIACLEYLPTDPVLAAFLLATSTVIATERNRRESLQSSTIVPPVTVAATSTEWPVVPRSLDSIHLGADWWYLGALAQAWDRIVTGEGVGGPNAGLLSGSPTSSIGSAAVVIPDVPAWLLGLPDRGSTLVLVALGLCIALDPRMSFDLVAPSLAHLSQIVARELPVLPPLTKVPALPIHLALEYVAIIMGVLQLELAKLSSSLHVLVSSLHHQMSYLVYYHQLAGAGHIATGGTSKQAPVPSARATLEALMVLVSTTSDAAVLRHRMDLEMLIGDPAAEAAVRHQHGSWRDSGLRAAGVGADQDHGGEGGGGNNTGPAVQARFALTRVVEATLAARDSI